ncbi:hypothetical protein E4U55_002247 [Claviceps digitariae]|nr:hypothetical protein E4U55_002247 [Claviceps digitariae]
MDRNRRTAATARRKTSLSTSTGGGSCSSPPISPAPAGSVLPDDAHQQAPSMFLSLSQACGRSTTPAAARNAPAGSQSQSTTGQGVASTNQSAPSGHSTHSHSTCTQDAPHGSSSQNTSHGSPSQAQIAKIAHSRRGSKSLHSAFSFATPASANRGQGIKRRSRTMDGYGAYGLPDAAFDHDSPRKGGHTLRKTPRVDYTFEHVDDEVVVPNSTSSRAKRRRLDHGFDSEDVYASALKTRRTSLGADTLGAHAAHAAHAPHAAAYGSTAPGDDEDVKDTIEVGVSYSDMDEPEIRRNSNSSTSSADHSFDAAWKSAPAAAAHFGPGPVYSNGAETAVANNGANVLDDNQEENIDPQLRASPPRSSPKPTVDVARPAEAVKALPDNAKSHRQTAGNSLRDGPLIGQTTDTHVSATASAASSTATTGQHTEPAAAVTSQPVSADEGAAGATKEPPSPISPAEGEAEEVASRDPESSVSDEIQQQLNGTEATVVPESSDATKTDVTAVSPEMGETLSSKPYTEADETGAPRTSSIDVADEHSAEHVAEDAAKTKDPAVDTTDSVQMANTKQSSPCSVQPIAIPSISVEQVSKPTEASAEEGQKGEEGEKQGDKEEEGQDEGRIPKRAGDNCSLIKETTTSRPTLNGKGKHKDSEDRQVIAVGTRDALKNRRPSQLGPSKPQPTPMGRWSFLTPYMDGEYVTYPEKKARFDDDAGLEETVLEDKDGADKDADKGGNDMELMVEDNDDAPDPAGTEAQTTALNTPLRGSPVADSMDPTASNSPAPVGDDAYEGEMSDSQEPLESRRYYRYRKLRDADEYVAALEGYEDLSTADLYAVLEAINVSLVQWETEWNDLGKVVDDYENSLRRRAADAKYEARTRNLNQHGVNHEEPDFVLKGYQAKEREVMSETRYLQGQDRIMSATYGFEYDPHPSKIGRQNPETQQAGIMTRGRSLRNQPKQTVKASEADEVTGKRQRRPVQLFDPATQNVVSRGSTPVPSRGRRRRHANNADEEAQVNFAASFNEEEHSDDAESMMPKGKRRRGPRASNNAAANAGDELATPRSSAATEHEEVGRSGRRRAARQPVRYDDAYAEFMDDDAQPDTKPSQHSSAQHGQQYQQQQQQQRRRRHLLTLKIPRSKNLSEPSSAITDNGDSRPSTASSESSSHTAESSYSFRPKRQKRFRDDPDEAEEAEQAPPRKRGKRSAPHSLGGGGGGGAGAEGGAASVEPLSMLDQHMPDAPPSVRKVHKIKVVRPAQDVRHDTPSSTAEGDGDEKPKDYKSMTKSEKMSASMKRRWANGKMTGAVEKRKATLAAKKAAAQGAADAKVGAIAPKQKVKPPKKEAAPEGHLPAGYVSAVPGINYSFSATP